MESTSFCTQWSSIAETVLVGVGRLMELVAQKCTLLGTDNNLDSIWLRVPNALFPVIRSATIAPTAWLRHRSVACPFGQQFAEVRLGAKT